MKYKTLQDALSEIKPQIKEDDVKKYFLDTMLEFVDLYENQIRKILKCNKSFELELYKDVFIRITNHKFEKSVTIGEEEIVSGTFYSKEGWFSVNCYLLINKSDGYNTINWETQKNEFMKNYKQIMKEFMERNKING